MPPPYRPTPRSRIARNLILGITFLPAVGTFLVPAYSNPTNAVGWVICGAVLIASVAIIWIVTVQDRADGISSRPRWWPAMVIPGFAVIGFVLLALQIRV